MGFWDAIDRLIDGPGPRTRRAARKVVRYAVQPAELVADSLEKGADLFEKAADAALGEDDEG